MSLNILTVNLVNFVWQVSGYYNQILELFFFIELRKLLFSENNSNALKYVSLITLTVQNALLGLSMRYARTREGDMFLSSTGNLLLLENEVY